MSAQPLPPPLSPHPLSQDILVALDRLSQGLDGPGLTWLSGYFAGRAAALQPGLPVAQPPVAEIRSRLTIVFASQTGNARRIAEKLKQDAESQGLAVRLFAAESYPQRELATERLLYLVASTHGDGEPPDAARGLFDFLLGHKAPKLPGLRFAVLALGDSSYPKFCESGRVLDRRLAELGAERAQALTELDLDFESGAAQWRSRGLDEARRVLGAGTPSLRVVVNTPPTPVFDRERPFAAELLTNQRLTTSDGWRDVRHLELSLADSGLSYQPGDALGVISSNSESRVGAWLEQFELDGSTAVQIGDRSLTLTEALRTQRELTRLARPLLAWLAEQGGFTDLKALLAEPTRLTEILRHTSPLALLRQFPGKPDAQQLVDLLRPLTPRLYSIASSREAVGDEVHLTVAVDSEGVASSFLGDRSPGDSVQVFIEPNPRFRLPADPDRDIIMIGPGTGVAPFRGFLQHRLAQGGKGRNWLFFGAPRLREDFLYQSEWLDARKAGQLKLDVAFSRDQSEKVYVQHRLRSEARDVHDWLSHGAQLYVCGDATRMAPDVHQALIDVVSAEGRLDAEVAAAQVNAWLTEGRYARDVY
ncbi:MAG: flavodoxin domain-containing protein [Ahniella sp.]|nr:flavodoxin domain-containing protein [Ahniella sp.]